MSGRTQALYNSAPFKESLYALEGGLKKNWLFSRTAMAGLGK